MPSEARITDCVVLFRITKADQAELNVPGNDEYRYHWTRGIWNMSRCQCLDGIEYALCVDKKYVVLEVYEIEAWGAPQTWHYPPFRRFDTNARGWSARKEFKGRPAQGAVRKYVGLSVKSYYEAEGPRNPIRCLCRC